MHKHNITTIQLLRGVAASLVVFYHGQHYLAVRGFIPRVEEIYNFGRSGVDVFFVLSGFIMVFITWDSFQKPRASVDFLIRRWIRIIPTYWFYSLVMVFLLLYLPQYFSKGKEFNYAHAIASFLFIPWKNSIGEVNPILSVGWTLNYEMYFYLVFSIVLLFRRDIFIGPLALILLGGVAAGLVFTPTAPVFEYMSSPLLVEFIMGCLIARLYKQGVCIGQGASLYLIGISIIVFVLGILFRPDVPRVILWGIPAAILLAGSVFLEKTGGISLPTIFFSLGDSSYSLYLSHMFSVHLVGKIWTTHVDGHFYLFTFVAYIVSVAVGYVSFFVLERPMIRQLNNAYKIWRG
jgi:peptidoglycan/LPS O-acetylase OafA/YrhL